MAEKHWKDTIFTYIWIFNVGRGLSIFIRTGLNQGIIYDFGSCDRFSPTKFVSKHLIPDLDYYEQDRVRRKIAQAIISHPHLDHISEIGVIESSDSPLHPLLLTCPHDKDKPGVPDERVDWGRVNNPDEAKEKVELYKSLYSVHPKRELPLQTIQYASSRSVPNLEYGIYYIRPPQVDELFPEDNQKYTNATSLVMFYRHGKHTLLIPGDMPPKALEYLLAEKAGCEKRYSVFDASSGREHPTWHERTSDQPSLKVCLDKYGVSVLLAPHHGLESGYSEGLYSAIKGGKPDLVVISEKRHLSEKDGKVELTYQSKKGANSLEVNLEGTVEPKYSLSTRQNHHILLVFPGQGKPRVYAEKDPEKLLEKT